MEDPPKNSPLQRMRTLPSVEDLVDEMSLEPYFALKGVISECVKKVEKVANCRIRMRGDKVHEFRLCARKIQAGGTLMALHIRKVQQKDTGHKRTLELEKEAEVLKKENGNLKSMMEGLTEQIKIIRETYSNEDFDDIRKMKRMEKEISDLKEERRIMKEEMDKMREKWKK